MTKSTDWTGPTHPLDSAEAYERRVLPARQLLHMLEVARDAAGKEHGGDWEDHLDEFLGGEVWITSGPIDLLLKITSQFEAAGRELITRIRTSAES